MGIQITELTCTPEVLVEAFLQANDSVAVTYVIIELICLVERCTHFSAELAPAVRCKGNILVAR